MDMHREFANSPEELVKLLTELGVVGADQLDEARIANRLREVFAQMPEDVLQDVTQRAHQELQEKPSGVNALASRCQLTRAEHLLLNSLCEGLSISEHAVRYELSKHTVRTHMQRIREKTGVKRQAEVVRLALQQQDD